MNEELTKAEQGLDMVVAHLRAALLKASEVEALLIYPTLLLIHEATRNVINLRAAIDRDQTDAAKKAVKKSSRKAVQP